MHASAGQRGWILLRLELEAAVNPLARLLVIKQCSDSTDRLLLVPPLHVVYLLIVALKKLVFLFELLAPFLNPSIIAFLLFFFLFLDTVYVLSSH